MALTIPVVGSKPMPAVGCGFWKVAKSVAPQVTVEAIKMGYRHLDCASDYGNEEEVGLGIAEAVRQSICSRDELWVTSKLWNTHHRPEHVLEACKKSLTDLHCDYLDLYLIHFPISLRHVPFSIRYPAGWFFDPSATTPKMEYDPVPIIDTWRAMESLVDRGLVRNIGISNFGVSLIRDLLTQCRIRPSVLQVELHPYLVQSKLVRFCQSESIALTGFSPLGAPSYVPLGMAEPSESVLDQPIVQSLARKYGKTPAQIVLRWGVQRGTSVIPKSSRPERLKENLSITNFELTEEEMDSISSLDKHRRFNDPGDFCESAFGTFFPIYE